MNRLDATRGLGIVLFALAALSDVPAAAQAADDASKPAEVPKSAEAPPLTLESLAWVEGCWRGTVNQREFREHWLPLRGGMMVGISQTVTQDKTQDYEYLRIEPRADGVYYVAIPAGKKESSFKLVGITVDDRATEFAFTNVVDEFPQRLAYRRGADGWLYASIEGKLNNEDRKVTYPMRRIDCESGEVIRK